MTRPMLNLRPRTLALAAAVTATMAMIAPAAAAAADAGGQSLPIQIRQRSLGYGATLQVSGRLAGGQSGPVALAYRRGGAGSWQVVKTTTAAADGRFTLRLRMTASGLVRVVAGPKANAASAGDPPDAFASTAAKVTVGAHVSDLRAQLHVLRGHRASVSGTLRTGVSGRTVRLQRRAGTGWVTIARTNTNSAGRFSVGYTPATTGTWTLRLRFTGDRLNTPVAAAVGQLNSYRTSLASWYGLYGGPLACGGRLGYNTLGVANRTLPCGTRVTIRYRGRSVTVPVIDRGPYAGGRDWDLTGATARRLGFNGVGTIWVTR